MIEEGFFRFEDCCGGWPISAGLEVCSIRLVASCSGAKRSVSGAEAGRVLGACALLRLYDGFPIYFVFKGVMVGVLGLGEYVRIAITMRLGYA